MAKLEGPWGSIAYTRDTLGYPSANTRSLAEASWMRGWFHAVDRLVQVQLALAIGRGEALALMGENVAARHIDRMTRIHRFTDDLDEQAARLGPEVREVVDAYCAGFAAGVARRGWPLLLRAVGIRPAAYRAQDMMLLYRVISWFGLTQLAETPSLLAGQLMAQGASHRALRVLLGDAVTADELASAPVASWPAGLQLLAASGVQGSNALAVAATHSATGGALLAADPHMEIGRIPPVLYATHTQIGDENVTGLSVPGLFWPSFGRTRHVAWAYTYGHVAQVDVRVVRCRRGEVHDGAEWRVLEPRSSRVRIRRRPDETWSFWDCDLGTIVGDASVTSETSLPCIRWNGLANVAGELDVALAMLGAKDVETFLAHNRRLSTIALDAVVADASGRIGHVLTGQLETRPPGCGGVVPHGAEPSVRVDEAMRPATIDPSSGWLASANARPLETGGALWAPMPEARPRIDRLRELMGGKRTGFVLDDLASAVLDACDAGARRLLAVWETRLPDDPRARELVAWAAQQPGRGDAHFASLTLWNVLHDEACRFLLDEVLGGARAARLLDELSALPLFQYHLDDALALVHPDLVDEAMLRSVLQRAWPSALAKAKGAAMRLPRRDRFRNPVFAGKLALLGFDSRPIELLGGPTTPNQVTAVNIGGQRYVFGAAGRFLCDMSKPGGWYCLAGGASERRFGVGYGKGLDAWARGELLPLGDPAGPPPSASRSTIA